MSEIFAKVGRSGGIETFGGSAPYESLAITHESLGTYYVTWDVLAVVPAVIASAQHGSDASILATPGYVTSESMYIYTRDLEGGLVDEGFSFVLYF